MSVRIRLRRIGRKKQPYYRVVVSDSRTPRDGAYLETVGFYNPRAKPAELRLSLERVDAWVADGAGLTDTVASLVRKARKGGDRTVAISPFGAPPEKKQSRAAAPDPAPPAPVAVAAAEPQPPSAEPAPEASEPAAEAESAPPADSAEPPAE
jgi:small subunit ribosomal protein S16